MRFEKNRERWNYNKTPKSLANRKRKISWCVATDCGHYSNIHFMVISNLGMPEGDMGSTIGSYAGLMLLISAYSSIRFSSTLSDNQIVALSSPYFLCFFFYFGFEGLSSHPLFYYNRRFWNARPL
jgi:hypothetical protein